MKKRILFIATVMFTAGALVLSGCKKEDTTPPEITLTGPETVNVSLNGTYTDQGATATDDEDGDITSLIEVSDPVDVNNAGTYTVTYTVSDAAGNVATETRTVVVSNDAKNLEGTYSGVDTAPYPGTAGPSFPLNVTASSTENNVLVISKFANYENAQVKIKVNPSTGSVDLAPTTQTVTAGNPALAHTFSESTVNTGSNYTTTGTPVITVYYLDQYTDPTFGPQTFQGETVYTKQ